jgi:uncharacterized protein YjbI with pentapeptide repeats
MTMANRKQVAMLRRSVADWNEWREEYPKLPDLRGADLRGYDLSGANLRGADIRGTRFGRRKVGKGWQATNLYGVNFSGAKAGVQWRAGLGQLVLVFILCTLASVLSSFTGVLVWIVLFGTEDSSVEWQLAAGIPLISCSVAMCVAIGRHGLTLRALTTILLSIAVLVTGTGVVAAAFIGVEELLAGFFGVGPNAELLMGGMGVVGVFLAGITAVAISVVIAISIVLDIVVAIIVAIVEATAAAATVTLATTVIFIGSLVADAQLGGVIVVIIAMNLLLLCVYVFGCRAEQGDEKFVNARKLGLILVSLGGTSFWGAKLTDATFVNAMLKSANFNEATLTRTNFTNAKKLDKTRPGSTILSSFSITQLLTKPTDSYGKKLTYVNLRGAYLVNANLEAANFTQADLADADLTGANLKDANFREANCLGTNFSRAYLTGACIDAWNINSQTQLNAADCQYVYLLSNGSDKHRQWTERRPSSGIFEPGEFTKLFQEVLDTIDLIFQDGIDWRAFVKTFDKLRIENGTSDLTVQSVENKGDGCVVVRVQAAEGTDKEHLHQEFRATYDREIQLIEERYQAELSAKSEQISEYREQVHYLRQDNSEIRQILGTMADKQERQAQRIINMGDGSTYRETTVSDSGQYAEHDIVNNEAVQGMTKDDILELLAFIENAIHIRTDLPDDLKQKSMRYLGAATEEAKEPKPDKELMASNLKKVGSTLTEAGKTVQAAKDFAVQVAPTMVKIGAWLGTALL